MSEQQNLVRFPKIYMKSKSTSSGTKSSLSLQDSISAKSWLYVTPHGTLGFRSNMKRQIASITKTMTAMCTLELCHKYHINIASAYFKITKWAASINGTSANLQAHSWISIEDLLYGLMLPSGNDAALVLAENLGAVVYFDKTGNKEMIKDVRSIDLTEDYDSIRYYMNQFISCMNEKAKSLGMTKTRFGNPHGLDHANNYSTCEDVVVMSKEAMKLPLFRTIVATPKHKGTFKTFKDKKIVCKPITWNNTNKLLERSDHVFGIKTGVTPKAGGCLSTFFKIDSENQGYIVVLGCSSTEARFKDTDAILTHIIEEINIF